MAKIRSQQLNPNLTGSFNLSGSFIVTGSLHSTNSIADSGSLASRMSTVEGNIGAQDLNTYATPTFAGLNLTDDTSITGSLSVTGDVTARTFIVSSSVSHFTQSFSSGSTAFGDTSDDSHTFTGNITASGNISGSSTSTGSLGFCRIGDKLAIWTTNTIYGPLEAHSDVSGYVSSFRLFPSNGLSGVQTNLATSFQIKAGTSATLIIDSATDDNAGIEFKKSGSLGPFITAQHNFSLFDIGTRNGYDLRLRPDSGIVDFDDNSIKDLLHLSASGNISGSSTSTGSFGSDIITEIIRS